MAFIDYYKILEIDKKASPEAIRKAFRKLARQYHPDLNPDNDEAKHKFQQVNEANEVLSDPEKRKKYDQYGENWKHSEEFEKNRNARRQQASSEDPFNSYSGGDFSDFFASMFGAGSGRGRNEARFKGPDYQAVLHLQLAEAYKTHQKVITVNGKNLRITIPAGIEHNQVIKLSGHGGKGVGSGPAGDLYITFLIEEDPKFKRLQNDLYLQVQIDLYSAVLGGEIILETLSGKIKLKIPAGTQNGEKVRLKGKGFPVYKKDGEFGNLIVTYAVRIPTDLTDRQKELFEELSKLESQKT